MERQLLARCLSAAADQIGAGWALPHTEIRIQSHPVALRSALATDGHDFLNSFIFVDLRSVADRVDQHGSGRHALGHRFPARVGAGWWTGRTSRLVPTEVPGVMRVVVQCEGVDESTVDER